jgi:hypothetical protein
MFVQKHRKILITVMIVIGVIGLIRSINESKHIQESRRVLQSNFVCNGIDGVLNETGIKYHLDWFTIKGDSLEYGFVAVRPSALGPDYGFIPLANQGDSLFKEADSRTLTLIHNGKTYSYQTRAMDKIECK